MDCCLKIFGPKITRYTVYFYADKALFVASLCSVVYKVIVVCSDLYLKV